MSTHAAVLAYLDGSLYGIYVHGDGYLNHTGMMLKKFYHSDEKVDGLMGNGDISFLTESLEANRPMNKGPAREFNILKDALDFYNDFQYIYFWVDNTWSMVDRVSGTRLYWYDSSDLVHVTCGICGLSQTVEPDNDFGEWSSEIFLFDHNFGPCCPKCLDEFCTHKDDTLEYQVDLSKVLRDNTKNLRTHISAILSGADMYIA